MNRFETAALLKGSLSPAQERWLIRKRIELGDKFNLYRGALRISAPIPRLSKSQAHRLIEAIARDAEGPQ